MSVFFDNRRLIIEGDLSLVKLINEEEQLKQLPLEQIASIDLTKVTDIDLAGLQWLAFVKKYGDPALVWDYDESPLQFIISELLQ